MNNKTAEMYDDIYRNAETLSTEPLPLVKLLREHLSGGAVLDIGAGGGRNSIYLASEGFDVLATDISEVGIERLKKLAQESGVSLRAQVADFSEEEIEGQFGAIVCTFTLHFLRESATALIQKMQQHTKSGGFNLITAYTKDGEFYKNNPTTHGFYLDNKEQLEHLYAGWNIIKSFEKQGVARGMDGTRPPSPNVFAGLLAQKPSIPATE
jgi:tellurite methyltransferase